MSARSVGLPPRRSLPNDVQIPVLPGLGQTWYDRHGASYWIRRAGLAFLWAFLTALVALILVSVLIAFYHRSLAAFLVVLGIEVVYTFAILGYFAVAAVRHWNDPAVAGHMFSRPGRIGTPGWQERQYRIGPCPAARRRAAAARAGPGAAGAELPDARALPRAAADVRAPGDSGGTAGAAMGGRGTARPRSPHAGLLGRAGSEKTRRADSPCDWAAACTASGRCRLMPGEAA